MATGAGIGNAELTEHLRDCFIAVHKEQERVISQIDYHAPADELARATARTRTINAVIRHLGAAICVAEGSHLRAEPNEACLLCGAPP